MKQARIPGFPRPALGLIGLMVVCGAAPQLRPSASSDLSRPCFDYRDVLAAKSIRSLLSPNGETLLAVVEEKDAEKNGITCRTWRIPCGDSTALPLTSPQAGDRNFQWKPDGTAVSFLGRRNGEEGLFLIPIDGGEPQRLFKPASPISVYRWKPDGKAIGLIISDRESPRDKSDASLFRDARVEDDFGPSQQVWIFDLKTHSETRLTDGNAFSATDMAWSPDGKILAFVATPSSRLEDATKTDIYTIAVSGVSPAGPARRLTANPGEDIAPLFSPDGKSIVYRSRAEGDLVGSYRISRLPASGGTPEEITPKEDLSLVSLQFGSDPSVVYCLGYRGVDCDIYRLDFGTGLLSRLTAGGGVASSLSINRAGNRMAFTWETPDRPQEVFISPLPAPQPKPVSEFNRELGKFAIGKTEVLRWKGAEGRDIEGLLIYPAGFQNDRRYPLIVQLHGGPAGLDTRAFDPEAQYFSGLGYFIFRPNYRGSAGYGEAFRRLSIGDWGGGDAKDILCGVEALKRRPGIDHSRLAVMGWSYGGYLTARLISLTAIFKAAIIGAGFEDNLSMWGTQDSPPHFAAYFGGHPFERGLMPLYRARSPLDSASAIRTPVLLLHGENDRRVPPEQALLFYRALQANHVPAELVRYPRMSHAPQEPVQQLDILQRQAAWLSRYLQNREMELWKEPLSSFIPPLPKADATHRFLPVPYDAGHPEWGTFRLFYETNSDFDPAKPTLMHILDGQSPQFAAGAPDRMKKDYGLDLNIVQIEHRGMPASPTPLISKDGPTDWAKAFAVFQSSNVVSDIDAVRRDLLGSEGRIHILGQSGGAILACQYLARYGRWVDRAVIERGSADLSRAIAGNRDFFNDLLKGQGAWEAFLRVFERKPVPIQQFLWLLEKLGYDYPPAEGMQARLIRELDEGKLSIYESLGRTYGLVDDRAAAIISFAPFAVVRLFEVFFPLLDGSPADSSMGLFTPLFAPLAELRARGVLRPEVIRLDKEMPGVKAESLILASRWDHVMPYRDSLDLGRLIPRSRVIIADDTHLMIRHRSCRFRLIKAFLEKGLQAEEINDVLRSPDCHLWTAPSAEGSSFRAASVIDPAPPF
jgi:dipeptidyl aminopeptidase/acylaminoacyl peptidase